MIASAQMEVPPEKRGLYARITEFLGGPFYRKPQLAYALLAGTAGLFVAVFFGYPLLKIFKFALFEPEFTTEHFREIFLDPKGFYLRVFLTTFRIAATVTLLTFVIGYPMAGLLMCASKLWQRILMVCIILPFWTSVLVRKFMKIEALFGGR